MTFAADAEALEKTMVSRTLTLKRVTELKRQGLLVRCSEISQIY